jgi:hypothetical protein
MNLQCICYQSPYDSEDGKEDLENPPKENESLAGESVDNA